MRKKLIYYLSALFLLFTIGAGLSIYNTYKISRDIESVINLHRVEIIRQNLIINTQTVQGNLYTTGTTFGKELDVIVENVIALEEASRNCLNCHHNQDVADRLNKIVRTVEQYEQAISQLITTTANEKRIERLKMVAIGIGDSLLSRTQEMAFLADKSLNAKTIGALKKINYSRFILLATVIFAFLIGVLIAFKLTEMITKPINELVNATRIIASGDLGYTLSYDDRTEFGELARNFNAMSSALKEGYENISQQKQKLTESEWKFRTLSEFASDWEYWINEKREVVFISASCEQVSGYTQQEFIDNPDLRHEMVHPEDKNSYAVHMDSFLTAQHEEIEFRIITKTGKMKWLSHVCRPIYIEDRFLGRRVSNRDITDKKILEEQLLQSQKMESLGLMAGGVAHDFNNLLTAITGYASLLQHGLDNSDETTKRYVQQVLNAAERAQNLTGSLLAFSRKQIMKPNTIKLNEVIRNISDLLKSLIGEDIEVLITCSETESPVFADPNQIEQVVMNLVTNARDSMPAGGRIAIGTTSELLGQEFAVKYNAKPGRYMMLSISDTGSGIDKKDIPHIFEPFFTTKEKNRGTGLGLAMVYGIIKQHGGFIDIYTEKGWGTTFKIYLPASEETKGEGNEAVEVQPHVDLRGTETILVAEDEEAVRGFMEDALRGYGYKVLLAVDGSDAIKKYVENKEHIDMIILDVVMPKRNGKEVYNHIKKTNPDVRTLFMSGYTQDILTSRGIYEEGLEFISKPVEINNLMAKIKSILNS